MTGEPELIAPDPAPMPQPPDEPAPGRALGRRARGRGAAAWLIVLLVLIIAGVATAPFWGPPVMPLLPWSRNPAADRAQQALAARLAALERQNAALTTAQGALSRRLDDSAAMLTTVKAGLADLGRRIDTLAARKAAPPALDPAAMQKLRQEIANLGQRVEALSAQAAARPAGDPAAVQKLQGDLTGLDRRAGDLANRVASLETRVAAPARAGEKTAALLVALLGMREGVEAGQPFADSYANFLALARDHPPLLAAAKPLAPFAAHGVARRAALARDLSHLAGRIATARAPAAADDWGGRVLDQLRRLVTIRRIGGGPETPPEAAVQRAETALARGDLAGAVQAIATLSGPSAAAAQSWLAEARRRLAAETALAQVQQKLEADIVQQAAPAPPAAAPQPKPEPHP